MTKYREILRLHSLGLSQKDIAGSCNVSKKTVNKVLKALALGKQLINLRLYVSVNSTGTSPHLLSRAILPLKAHPRPSGRGRKYWSIYTIHHFIVLSLNESSEFLIRQTAVQIRSTFQQVNIDHIRQIRVLSKHLLVPLCDLIGEVQPVRD